ncbi:MAG: STAS/SEC14 domain-containing protein [Chitinophagales bacterium]|nr:STAS/SEC14 domain-containing protein [Chitinophagales bacterium]
MIEFIETESPKAVAVAVSGEITMDDYNQLNPVVENKVKQYGKIPVLLRIDEGIDQDSAKGLLDGGVLDKKRLKDFAKIAVVTDNSRFRWLLRMARFFVPGELKLFKTTEQGKALQWVAAY